MLQRARHKKSILVRFTEKWPKSRECERKKGESGRWNKREIIASKSREEVRNRIGNMRKTTRGSRVKPVRAFRNQGYSTEPRKARQAEAGRKFRPRLLKERKGITRWTVRRIENFEQEAVYGGKRGRCGEESDT